MDKKSKAYKIGKDFEIDNLDLTAKTSKDTKKKRNNMLAKYVDIGYYLLTPLMAGVFLGVFVDKIFSTKPIFTLVGISLGTIALFYNLVKMVRSYA